MSGGWTGVAIDGPILVVAPHPDDETLGCGGLIASASRRNLCVHTVFITDGSASHPNSATWNRQRLTEQRELEAAEALRKLGAGEQPRTFLRLKDSDMPPRDSPKHAQVVAALAVVLRDLSPRLVLLPWRRDPHRDHRDSWQFATDAIVAAGKAPRILEYAIWLPEFGQPADWPRPGEMVEVSLDISADCRSKQQAVQAYRSQIGKLITDDPSGFALDPATIDRLTSRYEVYWRPCGA